MIRIRSALAAVALLASLSGVALAQQMPTPAEIQKRIEEEMAKLPTKTAEHALFKIEYKEFPTDPKEIVKQVAAGQVPPGMDPEMLVKQYLPIARPYLEKYAQKLGTLTVTKGCKWAKLEMKEGEVYDFGLLLDETVPIGVILGGASLKQPVKIPLKPKKAKEKFAVMNVEIVDGKSGADIQVGFADILGTAGSFKAK